MVTKIILKVIKELNVIFKEKRWKLLPEDNTYRCSYAGYVIFDNQLVLLRETLNYNGHRPKYSTEELDDFIMEFILPICKKYDISSVFFNHDENTERGRSANNSIDVYKKTNE